ncbi:MAG: hypothetical protein R6U84_09320, partial [Candidatus Cloacimonadales bacterium]
LTDLGVELRRKNTIFDFTVDFMQEHEAEVTLSFEADAALIEEFFDFARSKEIEFTAEEAEEVYEWVKVSLESGVIEKKFGNVEGYKRSIEHDTQLQEALQLFQKYQSLDEMFEYSASLKEEI